MHDLISCSVRRVSVCELPRAMSERAEGVVFVRARRALRGNEYAQAAGADCAGPTTTCGPAVFAVTHAVARAAAALLRSRGVRLYWSSAPLGDSAGGALELVEGDKGVLGGRHYLVVPRVRVPLQALRQVAECKNDGAGWLSVVHAAQDEPAAPSGGGPAALVSWRLLCAVAGDRHSDVDDAVVAALMALELRVEATRTAVDGTELEDAVGRALAASDVSGGVVRRVLECACALLQRQRYDSDPLTYAVVRWYERTLAFSGAVVLYADSAAAAEPTGRPFDAESCALDLSLLPEGTALRRAAAAAGGRLRCDAIGGSVLVKVRGVPAHVGVAVMRELGRSESATPLIKLASDATHQSAGVAVVDVFESRHPSETLLLHARQQLWTRPTLRGTSHVLICELRDAASISGGQGVATAVLCYKLLYALQNEAWGTHSSFMVMFAGRTAPVNLYDVFMRKQRMRLWDGSTHDRDARDWARLIRARLSDVQPDVVGDGAADELRPRAKAFMCLFSWDAAFHSRAASVVAQQVAARLGAIADERQHAFSFRVTRDTDAD